MDDAILEAAGSVLVESGPAGFTVDAVAARAGVSKTTVYRRWPTKGALLLGAARQAAVEMTDPDTGSMRDDLIAHMTGFAAKMQYTLAGRLLPALLAEASTNPEVRSLLTEFVQERRDVARTIVLRGIERGELASGTDVDVLLDLLAGPLFLRVLFTLDPLDEQAIVRSIDAALRGFR